MQIERTVHQSSSPLGATGKAYCALECKNCSGICLSVYFMLTPDERDAVYQLATGSDQSEAAQNNTRRMI